MADSAFVPPSIRHEKSKSTSTLETRAPSQRARRGPAFGPMLILYWRTGDAPAAVGQSGFDDEKSSALLTGAECSLKTDSKRDRGGATSLLRHGFSYDRKKTYWSRTCAVFSVVAAWTPVACRVRLGRYRRWPKRMCDARATKRPNGPDSNRQSAIRNRRKLLKTISGAPF